MTAPQAKVRRDGRVMIVAAADIVVGDILELVARTQAFATLVFAELLRAFGARIETRPVWRIPLSTNITLVMVVMISFGLQV